MTITAHVPWRDTPSRHSSLDGRYRLPTGPPAARAVTPREREVWHLLAIGASEKDIAYELEIDLETVRNHLWNLRDKLTYRKNTALAALWFGELPYSREAPPCDADD
jgi:DNA-binding NarL/FixJ family response regulator